ncbi:MAG: hypothetical protein ACRETH_00630 [Steroidobacteraceae bacterium]
MTNRPLAKKVAVVVVLVCAVGLAAATSRAQDDGTVAPVSNTNAVAAAPASASAPGDSSVVRPATDTPAIESAAPSTTTASAPDSTVAPAARKTALQKAVFEIKATAQDLARLTAAQRRKWQVAVASLPGFCQDWNRMLHDREVNNLLHLHWHSSADGATATYIGYGTVENCQAKESSEGVPIGKVTYEERDYALSGRNIDDAKTHPQLMRTSKTLEIFSYEKDRWFY